MMDLIGNHVWQSTLFAAAVALVTLFFRNNHAQIRYWLWLAASIKFLIPFSLFIAIGSSLDFSRREPTSPPQVTFSYVQTVSQPFGPIQSSAPVSRTIEPNRIPWFRILLYATWLCGFIAVSLLYLMRLQKLRVTMKRAVPLNNGRFFDALERLCLKSGSQRRIKLASAPFSIEPGVFGILKPVLLLPDGIVNWLNDSESEAIIAHEIGHVRRHDNLVATVHMIIEALFWFHPMVWWIGVKLVQERERACDEEVLKLGNNPKSYAEGILKVCEFCLESPLACVAGVTGSDMKKRIQTIMTRSIGHNLTFAKKLMLAIACFLALAIPVWIGLLNARSGLAQSKSGPKPSFEVVSVKPVKNGCQSSSPSLGQQVMLPTMAPVFQAGGRYGGCSGLTSYIMDAFDVERWRISGGPQLSNADALYQIDARAGAIADKAEVRLMIQSLLEKRFKLKTHWEVREVDGYSLVIAKGGHKLQQAIDENGKPLVALPPPVAARSVGEAITGMPDKGPGSFRFGFRGDQAELMGRAMSMRNLANALVMNGVGAPVVDKTGMAGLFDIDLSFDASQMRSIISEPGQVPAEPPSNASLLTAIQTQLGLKLERGKVPVQFIVIDSVEKPSEN